MNFEPSDEQAMIAETFARFLDEQSSMARVRAAWATGFDPDLWQGIAELGGFALLVPEADGGLGLGLFDAALLMDDIGRTLASGPIAEAMVAARILSDAGEGEWLAKALAGEAVVTIALHDAAEWPVQWVPGGAVADRVIARDGDALYLVIPATGEKVLEPNLAGMPMAEIRLDGSSDRVLLGEGADALAAFAKGLERWKLLAAATLSGLGREAVRLASAYASERAQFGQLIGTYQGISHPLADLHVDLDGGRLLVWRALRDLADDVAGAGAEIPLALWWNSDAAGRAVAQALHTFGGYGLTTEYDIHLYTLRAKAIPLMLGDPSLLLEEAGRRLYGGETAPLPEAGEVPVEFDLGEEARVLAADVDAFFIRTLTPELKAKAHYSFDGHDAGVHRKLAEEKLLFPAWRPELGGRNAGAYAQHAALGIWEKHGWTTHAVGVTKMVGTIIDRFGSGRLKEEVLSRIVAGEVICSLGFSEPASGSDVFSAQTRALRDGDDWRIDGQKMFTSGADQADYVLMLTRTNFDVAKHKGLTMFIVPLKGEGVEIQPVHTFQDERTNITYYDGVRIPDAYRLGEVDGGVKVMSASLELEQSATWIEAQKHLLHSAETVCRETLRAGRPMIEKPGVAARLARVFAGNLVTEMLGFRSLWAATLGKPADGYGSMVKLFSSERFRLDSADLLDLTAPESLSHRKGPGAYINLSYRHAQGATVYGGTSEVHRSVVAERVLGLPRTRA